jgi:galactonate dehydratase
MRLGVRITGVSTRVLDAGDRDWVFVRVDTDEPGLAGWGEASLGWYPNAVLAPDGGLLDW